MQMLLDIHTKYVIIISVHSILLEMVIFQKHFKQTSSQLPNILIQFVDGVMKSLIMCSRALNKERKGVHTTMPLKLILGINLKTLF